MLEREADKGGRKGTRPTPPRAAGPLLHPLSRRQASGKGKRGHRREESSLLESRSATASVVGFRCRRRWRMNCQEVAQQHTRLSLVREARGRRSSS